MIRNGDNVTRWLLDADPAVRWQVLRDIVGAADRTVERERRKVARLERGGAPSRWNTLRALRVLKWEAPAWQAT